MKRLSTKSTHASLTLAVAGLTLAQSGAQGQIQHVPVRDLVKQNVENGKQAEVMLPSPAAVLPGEILREQLTLKNVSGKLLNHVRVTVPFADGTGFTGSAALNRRWSLTYSADHGNTSGATPMQSVTLTENGETVTKKVIAPTSTYTNVRVVTT